MRTIKYLLKYTLVILFTMLQIAIFFLVWQHYEVNTYFNNLDKAWAIISSYTILLILFSKFFGVYDVGHRRFIDIIFGHFLTIILTNTLTYLQLCLLQNYPYLYSIKVILLIILINFILMVIGDWILQRVYFILTPIKNAILLTLKGSDLEKELISDKPNKKFKIQKTIEVDLKDEEIKELRKELDKFDIIIIDDIPPFMRNNILKYCYENNKKCFAKPKISDIFIRSAKFTKLRHDSMMMYDVKEMETWQSFVKRTFDITLSLIGLIGFSPLFAIVALIIKLTDGGPVFFTQERYTKDRKVFKIYKFRSMYVQNSKKVQLTTKNDKRVTPIGKIIRRTHVDELPQLYNILKGEMSFVGPRPEMIELYDVYCKKYPEYRYRLKFKAGLTGYAQVYGKYNTSPQDKLKFDLIYICNFSLFMDFKLMLLTIKIIFAKDTSEGIDDNKKNALKDG